jgi:hypothetical protein
MRAAVTYDRVVRSLGDIALVKPSVRPVLSADAEG